MKEKKGFIATSIIYSFFLVFLMLMTVILVRSANNRILLGTITDDIKSELNSDVGFIIETIEAKNYAFNEAITFANETWYVLQNKTDSVVVVLSRSLTQGELINALGKNRTSKEYMDENCNETTCMIKACKGPETFSGQEFCYLYKENQAGYNLHTWPSWSPDLVTQVQTGKYGKTIVSEAVNVWFSMHQGLIRAMDKDKLVNMTFSDGFQNATGYVRIPLSSEVSGISGPVPFHLVDSVNNGLTEISKNGTHIRIYNNTVQNVISSTLAYVRPVVEIKKG